MDIEAEEMKISQQNEKTLWALVVILPNHNVSFLYLSIVEYELDILFTLLDGVVS